MKTLSRFAVVCVVLALPTLAVARPVILWTYEKLTAEADLIVIATPTAVKDTGRKTEFPGIKRTGTDNISQVIPAIEMEANFQVLAVLKGDQKTKDLIFHYLREEPAPAQIGMNAPELISFDPNKKRRYLLFLHKEPSGGYSSLAGQVDPIHAIKDLDTYP